MSELAQALADTLQALLSQGYKLPLHIAGISPGGAAFVATQEAADVGLFTSSADHSMRNAEIP